MEIRTLLEGVQGEMAKGHGRQNCHRLVDRKVHCAVAQLRRRADALWKTIPGRRCRPHRPADWCQRAQPCGFRRFLSVPRADRRLPCRQNTLPSLLFRHGIAPRMGAARMSWWLTMLLHRFPGETPFEEQMRLNQFDYLHASEHAQASLAEQYVGLPFEA